MCSLQQITEAFFEVGRSYRRNVRAHVFVVPPLTTSDTFLMAFDVQKLLALWSDPLPEGEAGNELIRSMYTDPVIINGTPMAAAALADRARITQATFAGARREVLSIVEDDRRVAVAFRMSGRQVGPFPTTAGILPPTGKHLSVRVIDILDLDDDGRIASLWMVADELGGLSAIGAAGLIPAAGEAPAPMPGVGSARTPGGAWP